MTKIAFSVTKITFFGQKCHIYARVELILAKKLKNVIIAMQCFAIIAKLKVLHFNALQCPGYALELRAANLI